MDAEMSEEKTRERDIVKNETTAASSRKMKASNKHCLK